MSKIDLHSGNRAGARARIHNRIKYKSWKWIDVRAPLFVGQNSIFGKDGAKKKKKNECPKQWRSFTPPSNTFSASGRGQSRMNKHFPTIFTCYCFPFQFHRFIVSPIRWQRVELRGAHQWTEQSENSINWLARHPHSRQACQSRNHLATHQLAVYPRRTQNGKLFRRCARKIERKIMNYDFDFDLIRYSVLSHWRFTSTSRRARADVIEIGFGSSTKSCTALFPFR